MAEERRYEDLRMNNMENDLQELKENQKEMSKSIGEIREKIFNGFSHSITESYRNTNELKKAMTELSASVNEMKVYVYQTPEQRLANCPLKKEMLTNYEKSLKMYLAWGAIFIAFVAGLPSWIKLFMELR